MIGATEIRATDALVVAISLAAIVLWGTWRTRRQADVGSYFLAGRGMPWWLVAVSIMATQASAITFLSTPGQAYSDGMRFVQFYFGLPIAMVILSTTAVPIFHRLRVFTAYEYLETRFDAKTRTLAATFFLVQRGLAAGLTIYAPAIVLSVLMGWSIHATTLLLGGLVVVYTAVGGAEAVGKTQFLQMLVILTGMGLAFDATVRLLPEGVSLLDAVAVAGVSGRMRVVDFSVDFESRYTLWSGLFGGLFLALSYFGTDQSQVQRYLTGRSITQSRLALLFNGILKVPMQFAILFLGVMVFAFYQFAPPPLFFDPVAAESLASGPRAGEWQAVSLEHDAAFEAKRARVGEFLEARLAGDAAGLARATESLRVEQARFDTVRARAAELVREEGSGDGSDVNYVFLRFVLEHLPIGIVGLVLAAIFAASMSSTAAELNALASTSVVDVYRRWIRPGAAEASLVRTSRLFTLGWGIVAIAFAQVANRLGTLVEAVNVLGSLFYGTVLGVFLVAFFLPRVRGTAVFAAALVAEACVLSLFFGESGVSYLWFNAVGCGIVVALSLALTSVLGGRVPGNDRGGDAPSAPPPP